MSVLFGADNDTITKSGESSLYVWRSLSHSSKVPNTVLAGLQLGFDSQRLLSVRAPKRKADSRLKKEDNSRLDLRDIELAFK